MRIRKNATYEHLVYPPPHQGQRRFFRPIFIGIVLVFCHTQKKWLVQRSPGATAPGLNASYAEAMIVLKNAWDHRFSGIFVLCPKYLLSPRINPPS